MRKNTFISYIDKGLKELLQFNKNKLVKKRRKKDTSPRTYGWQTKKMPIIIYHYEKTVRNHNKRPSHTYKKGPF